ncbi:Rabankyrin-5 [Sarcoptes scabiei]|uniref:Rabankyrin-5 n=1 Tax=Sarcoptes scabiei TaxID=52283 RepID=A0A834VJI2_SARSC|nr:Rabankyrin-5 [Sarcoptes scabiei]
MQSLEDENEKLKKRLALLRDEYTKLQKKYFNLENHYNLLINSTKSIGLANSESNRATSSYPSDSQNIGNQNLLNGSLNDDHHSSTQSVCFIRKVIEFIGSLYQNPLYSDLVIEFEEGKKKIPGHKFVLSFRSDKWCSTDLTTTDRLSFPEMSSDVAEIIFDWVYTGNFSEKIYEKENEFLLELVEFAVRFDLQPLIEQCESILINCVQIQNCIYFYQISEKLNLSRLCEYSAQLVSINWDSLTAEDFEKVSIQFLHRLFVEKSPFPLHKAIRIKNEDLIFLLLTNLDNQSQHKINEPDNLGQFPLDLAVRSGQFSIAKTLLEHHANINGVDSLAWPFAHRYVAERMWNAAEFMIENGFNIDSVNSNGDSLIHLCADLNDEKMLKFSNLLLQNECDLDLQNETGQTALHRCILSDNLGLFDQIMLMRSHLKFNLDIRDKNSQTPFDLALKSIRDEKSRYIAERILQCDFPIDLIDPKSANSPLLQSALDNNEEAALFLIEKGANIYLVNNFGQSVLHIGKQTAFRGLRRLVSVLLQKNINCNLQTLKPFEDKNSTNPNNENDLLSNIYGQTALHLAILGENESIIQEILSYHNQASRKGCIDSILLTPDLEIKNSEYQTPLALAVEMNVFSIAQLLISAGANINIKTKEGDTLLYHTIITRNILGSKFLLQHGIDISVSCRNNQTYLELAVKYQQPAVVDLLCRLGARFDQLTSSGDHILWEALKIYKETEEIEIASVLIQRGCEPDGWHQSSEGFFQTLLHRALDANNEKAAVFLIQSNCDIHCVRRPGPKNEGKEDCDGQTPLHMACSWGLVDVVRTLLEYKVNANLTDNEGKMPLHIAIQNQNHLIIEMLIEYSGSDLKKSDNYGMTPFGLSIRLKSKSTASLLCRRDPQISEQIDGKGRTYLHLALQQNDYSAVLFLLDCQVNVNARIMDSNNKAPIHLAAETGSEIILRTLVLAGSELNVLTSSNQTALHLASEQDKYEIVDVLIDLGIRTDVQDKMNNTAFHLAAIHAHHNTCCVFIKRNIWPGIDSETLTKTVNNKGHNIIHCLAMASEKIAALSIFEELVAHYQNLNLNVQDQEGHTALLLAYMNGNSKLCRSLVREGSSLGLRNNFGISIFNHNMPTRQLLTSLLDSLTRMPEWLDGSECLECGQKFNITNRRHHCRHCGRELCSRCSSKEIIIMKYQTDKKSIQSRVCEICYDVLTLGVFN